MLLIDSKTPESGAKAFITANVKTAPSVLKARASCSAVPLFTSRCRYFQLHRDTSCLSLAIILCWENCILVLKDLKSEKTTFNRMKVNYFWLKIDKDICYMTFEIHTAKCKILHFKSCLKCLVQKEKHNEQKILLFHFCCHFRAFTSTAATCTVIVVMLHYDRGVALLTHSVPEEAPTDWRTSHAPGFVSGLESGKWAT